MAIAWTRESRAGAWHHLMISIEAAHTLMPPLEHAVVSVVIRLSDRHEILGDASDLRNCMFDGHCLDSGVKSWGIASSHDVICSCTYPDAISCACVVIRLSDRHEILGDTADLRICT